MSEEVEEEVIVVFDVSFFRSDAAVVTYSDDEKRLGRILDASTGDDIHRISEVAVVGVTRWKAITTSGLNTTTVIHTEKKNDEEIARIIAKDDGLINVPRWCFFQHTVCSMLR